MAESEKAKKSSKKVGTDGLSMNITRAPLTHLETLQRASGSKKSGLPSYLSHVRLPKKPTAQGAKEPKPPAPNPAPDSLDAEGDAQAEEADSWEEEDEAVMMAVRKSAREATILNQQRLREVEERRARASAAFQARQAKAAAAPKIILTQDMLIAEALDVEEANRESLKNMLEREEDRRSRARHVKKPKITGPFIRWQSTSRDMGQSLQEVRAERTDAGGTSTVRTSERELLADPAVAARSQIAELRTAREGMGNSLAASELDGRKERTLLSLHDLASDSEDEEEVPWDEQWKYLLGDHTDWANPTLVQSRHRPDAPRQSICPITGLPAVYCDARTGIPIANAEAAKILDALLDGQFLWTGQDRQQNDDDQEDESPPIVDGIMGFGCYLERFYSDGARNVFERAWQTVSVEEGSESANASTRGSESEAEENQSKSDHNEEVSSNTRSASISTAPSPARAPRAKRRPSPTKQSQPQVKHERRVLTPPPPKPRSRTRKDSATARSAPKRRRSQSQQSAEGSRSPAAPKKIRERIRLSSSPSPLPPASQPRVKPNEMFGLVYDVAPGDEQSLLLMAESLPHGSTRSGRSRANDPLPKPHETSP